MSELSVGNWMFVSTTVVSTRKVSGKARPSDLVAQGQGVVDDLPGFRVDRLDGPVNDGVARRWSLSQPEDVLQEEIVSHADLSPSQREAFEEMNNQDAQEVLAGEGRSTAPFPASTQAGQVGAHELEESRVLVENLAYTAVLFLVPTYALGGRRHREVEVPLTVENLAHSFASFLKPLRG